MGRLDLEAGAERGSGGDCGGGRASGVVRGAGVPAPRGEADRCGAREGRPGAATGFGSLEQGARRSPGFQLLLRRRGAGTYSDGKLYTRSKKRGDIREALEWLVVHGADPRILVEAHPHIGTNRLPAVVTAMRETIERAGGQVIFETKVVDLLEKEGACVGVEVEDLASGVKRELRGNAVILATGHSARDMFELLHTRGLEVEAKPFAMGVRVEHPQSWVDHVQYHGEPVEDRLPPASYSLVCQVEGRGVHSFCMCPGGIVAPCATSPGKL